MPDIPEPHGVNGIKESEFVQELKHQIRNKPGAIIPFFVDTGHEVPLPHSEVRPPTLQNDA